MVRATRRMVIGLAQHRRNRIFQTMVFLDHRRLWRGDGAALTVDRAGVEVLIRNGGRGFFDPALNTDLPFHHRPIEVQSGLAAGS